MIVPFLYILRVNFVCEIQMRKSSGMCGVLHGLHHVSSVTSSNKRGNKGTSYLSTTQAVNVEIEGKVKKLKIVCDGSESLESKMQVQRWRNHDGQNSSWCCTTDK